MAVTPEQARNNNGKVAQEVKTLEKKIDEALPRLWADAGQYGKEYGVAITLRTTPTDAVIEQIKTLYRDAGWVVKYDAGSQMDPEPYFTFKEARRQK
jgi:hypothetical protein